MSIRQRPWQLSDRSRRQLLSGAARRVRFDDAVQALWDCVVQREALGLTDHTMLGECYEVPAALWRRLGAAARWRADPIG